MYESINPGDKDFSALISKMKQANIDVIFFGGYHTEAGLMVRQAKEQGLKPCSWAATRSSPTSSGRSPARAARRR